MKKLFYLFTTILLQVSSTISFAQLKEVDEKREFIGIVFLSPPDYSSLEYYRPGPYFNLYIPKNHAQYKTANYTISEIYIAVQKGVISDFTCFISKEAFDIIKNELDKSFSLHVPVKNGIYYQGTNLSFLLRQENSQNSLYIATINHDSIPDPKDQSGIVNLIGKKFSDESVKQFISSIPGKSEKKEYEGGYELTAPGFYSQFQGNGEEATLRTITIYLARDNYFYSKPAFKGSIRLPYGIAATTTEEQMTDLFGAKGKSDYNGEMNFNKFRIKAKFGKIYNKKTIEEERLIFLTIE